MKNYLGAIIEKTRRRMDLTQDRYGQKYGVLGPSIFKFEKGYMRPSLDLWMRMAVDAGLAEGLALLIWAKTMLPEEYREHVELQGALTLSKSEIRKKMKNRRDYAAIASGDLLREAVRNGGDLPEELREFVMDDESWALYKPTGKEVNFLRDTFSPLGRGSKDLYRDALRVMREFQAAK